MSKNFKSIKKSIQDRYKGRGNCWVKVGLDSKVYELIKDFLSSKNQKEVDIFYGNVNREGFAWMRFAKAQIEENLVKTVFEVRVRGSKEDHENYRLAFNDEEVKDLQLLGNTPHKLQLETSRKKESRAVAVKKCLDKKDVSTNLNIAQDLSELKLNEEENNKIKITTPSPREIKEWVAFLSAAGLLENDND